MSADVLRFPVVLVETPQRTEPMSVVTCALCRMNLLMAAYLQPGKRPDAELILMKINEILEEPALCDAAGIEKLKIIKHDEGAERSLAALQPRKEKRHGNDTPKGRRSKRHGRTLETV